MSVPDRPTREAVERALKLLDGSVLAVEVRALRAELAARTPQPAEPTIAERARVMGLTPRPIEDVIVGFSTPHPDEGWGRPWGSGGHGNEGPEAVPLPADGASLTCCDAGEAAYPDACPDCGEWVAAAERADRAELPAPLPAVPDVEREYAVRWRSRLPEAPALLRAVAAEIEQERPMSAVTLGLVADDVVEALRAVPDGEDARPHLVQANAPAMRKLLARVSSGEWTPADAEDVLMDWPNRAEVDGEDVPCASCGHDADHSGGECMWFDDVRTDSGHMQVACHCDGSPNPDTDPDDPLGEDVPARLDAVRPVLAAALAYADSTADPTDTPHEDALLDAVNDCRAAVAAALARPTEPGHG